jgi:PAS domain S-box-containing protein
MAGGKGTILVVDDDSESLALVTSILADAGYQVRPADSGRLALTSIEADVPDLILLDINMPGIDGLEVCRRLKAGKRTREIPIMFLSASADTDKRVKGLSFGAVDYVTKPFERAELLARVQTHLELGRLRLQLETQVAARTSELLTAVARLQQEVAERKRTEVALRESEQRFRNMADTAPVMIVISDAGDAATFFNKCWLEFTGRTVEQELGNGCIAGLHVEDRERALNSIRLSSEARRECNVEYRVRRADGEYRWVVCRGIPRFEPDGTFAGYIASVIDISDMKRAHEEALARQKLESLGVLAGGIAHDFNNLLSSISVDSELLLEELAEDSPARESVERIESVAHRAAEIVRQLMVYAGQESTVAEEVDLATLVREMLELMKVSISKQAVLNMELPLNLPPIRANAAQIRQVVMNLITNASDALQGKVGKITVRLSRIDAAPQPAPATKPSCDYLRLEVVDTGCGMTEEVRTRIFDPFFTTKSSGRGLGLAAVQGILRSHNGSISVSSASGRGSSFEILLPCARAAPLEVHQAVAPARESEHGLADGTVLVIDDEDTLRVAVTKMLRRRGFSTLDAADGNAGLELFRAHAAEIDAVLLDVTLPGLSGPEVLREMRRVKPKLNVILTTAYPRDRALAAADGQPCLYIRKPYQLSELTALLGEACRVKLRGDSASC